MYLSLISVSFLCNLFQVIETLEIYREMASNILDTHFSIASTRMNEIMKVLTIISTVFIPLSFIVGLYGMNFVYMPELQFHYGYYVALGGMLAPALIGFACVLLLRSLGIDPPGQGSAIDGQRIGTHDADRHALA